MPSNTKALFCWSGGKDSAFCLHKVLSEQVYDVKYLLTTLNATFKRISMHGVREELLDLQADSINIPLIKVWVREGSNAEYEEQMNTAFLNAKAEGIYHVIFGDIFLEDLRRYREQTLASIGMQAVFPLWHSDTTSLIKDIFDQGFKTTICCINDAYLGEDWLGKTLDISIIENLPANVDPCGENGEYHTFCNDGPVFSKPVRFTIGEHIFRPLEIKRSDDCSLPETAQSTGFLFCDLLP